MTHHLSWLDFGLRDPFLFHGALLRRPSSLHGLRRGHAGGAGATGASGLPAGFVAASPALAALLATRRGSSRAGGHGGRFRRGARGRGVHGADGRGDGHGHHHGSGGGGGGGDYDDYGDGAGRGRGGPSGSYDGNDGCGVYGGDGYDGDDGDGGGGGGGRRLGSRVPVGMVRDADGNLVERLTPRQERLAAELEEIYRAHGLDDKVAGIDKLMRLWEGREAELVRRARKKYEDLAHSQQHALQFRRKRSCSVCFEFDDPNSGYVNPAVCVHAEFNDGEEAAREEEKPRTPSRPAWR